jgi:hypothetical protein
MFLFNPHLLHVWNFILNCVNYTFRGISGIYCIEKNKKTKKLMDIDLNFIVFKGN